jgi:3-hydroxyisobutyrate dehydrogenase-like beta-hydroxyacid dehydrogenase
MSIEHTGLIGAGLMGHGIARNILRHGFGLAYLAHPGNRATEDLVQLGALEVPEIGDLVARSDVVLLCVTGSPQVEDIVLSNGGVAASIRPGQIVVDLSTVEPATTHRVHAAIEEKGAEYLDVPMTRTPKEAEEGRLNLLAGGDADTLESLRPLLSSFAENIYHAGPVGAGHALKLLHNFVSLGNAALLAEAVACAARTEVDTQTFLEVLRTGGGDSVALKRLTPYITEGDEAGFMFTIGNCAKDMTYYTGMAEALGSPAAGAAAIRDLYRKYADAGNAGLPVPRLIDLLGGR